MQAKPNAVLLSRATTSSPSDSKMKIARISRRTQTPATVGNCLQMAGRQGFEPARDERSESRRDQHGPSSQRASEAREVGWEAGIRTPITASRARCPTVERPPSIGASAGAGTSDSTGWLLGHASSTRIAHEHTARRIERYLESGSGRTFAQRHFGDQPLKP